MTGKPGVQSRVAIRPGTLTLRAPELFGADCPPDEVRRFARRVMALPEVHQLDVDPARGEAVVAYRVPPEAQREFLAHLAEVVGTGGSEIDESALPVWIVGDKIALSRLDGLITALGIVESKPGLLRVKAAGATALGRARARLIERALRAIPGVIEATAVAGPGKTLTVRFDQAQVGKATVIRLIEEQLANPGLASWIIGDLQPVPLGISHTTLGLGTVGELMLPLATPVAAGILVAINLSTAWDALRHLSYGKAGVPLARISLLVCTLATGQVVAAALTDWSLRYWQRRSRKRLVDEARRLLDETLTLPGQVQLIAAEGSERWVPVGQLRAGDHIRVTAGEGVAVDGEVVEGQALVDEAVLSETRAPVRKSAGDPILAGSRLLVGRLRVKAVRTSSETAAAGVAASFAEATSGLTRDPTLRRRSVRITERAVLPTLMTAGVGFVAGGGLTTMGPILRQDWISGPVLAVPMVTLHTLRAALQSGILVRNVAAISRLAESSFIVLDGDDHRLSEPGVELAAMQSRLADVDSVLRHVAGAGLFLGDERSMALANACRERGLIIRQPSLLAFDTGRVEVRLGQHVIRLSDGAAGPSRPVPELLAEIDGHEVARLSFRPGSRPRAAAAVQRLRAAGVRTFLVSAGAETATRALAEQLGVDQSGGELDTEGRIRFLQGLQRRGIEPSYVGLLAGQPELAGLAHVGVATDGMNGYHPEADMVLLGRSYESLADLVELARRYEPQIAAAARMALIPNLLCVAGGFAGVLNGIAANVIANVGVMNVDRQLQRTLGPGGRDPGRRSVVPRF